MGVQPHSCRGWACLLVLLAVLGAPAQSDAEIMIVAGSDVVLAGTVVELPIMMAAIGVAPGESFQIAGIELDLGWDPGVLFLQGLDREPPLQSWLVAENVERARARIAFASHEGLEVGLDAVHIATLRFLTSPQPGETEVTLEPIPVQTSALYPVPTTTASGIVQTVGTVSAPQRSIGTLKVVFHASE